MRKVLQIKTKCRSLFNVHHCHVSIAARDNTEKQCEQTWDVKPIGVVESPYIYKFGVPKQATIVQNDHIVEGKLIVYPDFKECISCIDEFDYIWVISLMHLNRGFKTKIRPQPQKVPHQQNEHNINDTTNGVGALSSHICQGKNKSLIPEEVGLFSSRAPHRPNPIALSALKVSRVDYDLSIIYVEGIDLLNGTPILDIKPYIPAFDAFPTAKAGWMDMINSDPLKSRITGYQNIYSARGARAARAIQAKKKNSTYDSFIKD